MTPKDFEIMMRKNDQVSIARGSFTTVYPEVPESFGVIAPSAPKKKSVSLWKSEREFQQAVFDERDRLVSQYPELALLYHISNENAHRNPGVLAGVPDLVLPVPRGGLGSCFVELKVGKNDLSFAQKELGVKLQAYGNYWAVVWDSVEEVFQHLVNYLNFNKEK